MGTHTNIITAILNFDNWSQPWLFRQSMTQSLGEADAKVFEKSGARSNKENVLAGK